MRIAVVGNAADLLVRTNGDVIDGHDRIIRINSFKISGIEAYVGTRVDIVSLCFASALVGNVLHHSKPDIAKASEYWTPYPKGYHKKSSIDAARKDILPAGAAIKFPDEIVPKLSLKPCFDSIIEHRKTVLSNRRAELFRPTTGILTLLLAEAAFPGASISVTGFGLNAPPSALRVDTSGAKMWEYHDLDWERRFLMNGCVQNRWNRI